jgi:hypothetical protein
VRATLLAVVLAACHGNEWLPEGAGCPPPDPWTWADVVKAPDWQAWTQTRASCTGGVDYQIWAQVGRDRTLLFEGSVYEQWWTAPTAITVGGRPALAFGGRVCALERGAIACR